MGNRIRELRKSKHLSQEKLAEMVDVTTGFISGIETGKKPGSFGTYIKIANVLGTTLDYLSQGIGRNFRNNELNSYFEMLSREDQCLIMDFIRRFSEQHHK